MKRLNPQTNEAFKRGDVREDGYFFKGYITTRVKANGFFIEEWLHPDKFCNIKKVQKVCSAKHYKENKTKYAEKAKKWAANNPEKATLAKTKWREENREQHKAANRNWNYQNRHKKTAYTGKRRAAQLQRTPKWLTADDFQAMEDMYTIAKMFQMYTGEMYHVDHILPLQGKKVSGLHVPANLQVLPHKENLKKSNKHHE